MKDELIAYATYTLLYRYPKKQNQSIFFSDIFLGICISMMLIICSVPVFMTKIWLWFALFVLWILLLLYRKRENNEYMKAILIDGLLLIYAAIFTSYLLVVFSATKSKYFYAFPLILVTALYLLTYELVILIQIKRKRYSYKKQIIASQSKKSNTSLIFLLSLMGSFLGVILSKLTSKFIPFTVYQIIFVSIIGLICLCGVVLIQKYVILKILKNTI